MTLVRSPLHLLLLFISILAAASAAATERTPNSTTSSSSTCPSYRCGHTVDIRYPFWIDDASNASSSSSSSTHCGYPSLRLECRRETPVLPLPSGDYAVTHIMYGDRTLSLFDLGVFSLSNTCPLVGRNLSLPSGSPPPLSLTARDTNLTFFVHCSFVGIPAHLVACLEGDGRHHSYVFRDGDELAPYGYAGLCQRVVGMPVLRRSLLGAAGSGSGSSSSSSSSPLDAVVPALNMGFELSWRPEADGECGQCERASGLCGRRRREGNGPWTFACFRAPANPAWIPPKTPGCVNVASPGNSSVVAFHSSLADDPTGVCRATRFNVSATLALSSSLLTVSRTNWELFLCSNCSRTPPAGSVPMNCSTGTGSASVPWIVYLSRRSYGTGGGPVQDTTSSTGCKYSAVPVLPRSTELRALGDYARLVRQGFLMEWTVPGDCAACNASGGQCRHDGDSVDAFRCLCPDGRLQPATCARGSVSYLF